MKHSVFNNKTTRTQINMFICLLCLMLIIALSPSVMAQPSCNPLGSDTQGMSVDDDADGLIEICTIAGLNAIRHQLDGTGYTATDGGTKATSGCPVGGCKGYELISNLDFDDYSYPDDDAGWEPIGTATSASASTFEGNNHTIDNLRINRVITNIGLFGFTASNARIVNIGLLNVNVAGRDNTGGLVGQNNGTIANSYATGNVASKGSFLGGLVGWNHGTIINSYATGNVEGDGSSGGLVGRNNGSITNSYTAGNVKVVTFNPALSAGGLVGINQGPLSNSYAVGNVKGLDLIGGLVGLNIGSITSSYATKNVEGQRNLLGGLVGWRFGGSVANSYWNKETSGQTSSVGSGASAGLTTMQLQSPTAPNATNPNRYTNWNTNDWDFGTASDYPKLKYARGSDTNNPACHQLNEAGQPKCGTVLPGQNFPTTINTTATVVVGSDKMAVEFDDITEGDTVELDPRAMDFNEDPLTFLWTEEGSNITSEIDKTKATLQFTVPATYTGTMTSQTLIFMVSVSDGVNTTQTERIELNVKQKDNGPIMNRSPTFDSGTAGQLNAPTFSANDDPDGVDSDTITYQWQSCASTCLTNNDWTTISGATQASYTIPPGTSEQTQFRVKITYQDAQEYQGTLYTTSISQRGIRMRLKLFLEGALQ